MENERLLDKDEIKDCVFKVMGGRERYDNGDVVTIIDKVRRRQDAKTRQSLLDSVGTPSKLRRKIARLQVWMPSGEPKRYVGTDLADEILPLIKLSTAQAVEAARIEGAESVVSNFPQHKQLRLR
jgi:hypothetical protein